MSKEEWKQRECGGLWLRQGTKGDFYSGYVEVNGERQEVVAYLNTFKKDGSNEADVRVYVSKPKPKNNA
jgi:hypothetical protein